MVSTKRGFYTGLFTLALPIMAQTFINSLVNMVDTVMIGRLGTVEIAAVGLGNQIYFLLNMIFFGITSGGAVFTAQFWGKKDLAGIKRATGFCLALVISAGFLFTAVCFLFPRWVIGLYSTDPAVILSGARYLRTVSLSFIPFGISFVFVIILRSVERIRVSLYSTIISLSLNVLLNYLFIFGAGPIPALGVLGQHSRRSPPVSLNLPLFSRLPTPNDILRRVLSANSFRLPQHSRLALPSLPFRLS